jgi:NAD(P)-dependent dehydrogenase (short-subunit alcohol dehydrogenase family)
VDEFKGRVAVVTGAASGIGRALAGAFAAESMRVVLADIEPQALEKAVAELESLGHEVSGVVTDVSDPVQVDALADRTLERFGAVHVVCNNAGVIGGGCSWQMPLEEYRWILDVNVLGVVNGVRTFVPILLDQGEPAHIVNTSSMAGLTSMPYVAAYHMSKHAVVALSECLYHELALAGARVKVSVLCPEGIATRIHEAARNRPERYAATDGNTASVERQLVMENLGRLTEQGVAPAVIAGRVLAALREERFYILAEDEWRAACETRLEDVRLGRNPTFAPPS